MPDSPTGPGKQNLEQVGRVRTNHIGPVSIDSTQHQYLSFLLSKEWYALSVDKLVEILPLPRITRVPSVPDHILGVMNLRGEVVSAIDLKRFLGLPRAAPYSDPTIVVVEQREVRAGLLVDTIGDLMGVNPKELNEEPPLVGGARRSFFHGACRWGEVLVSIINLETLLQSEALFSLETE